jgi:hypothetical protein
MHVGCYKIGVTTTSVIIGEWFEHKDATHNKNERIHMGRGNDLVLNFIQVDIHRCSQNTNLTFKHFSFVKPWLTNEQK